MAAPLPLGNYSPHNPPRRRGAPERSRWKRGGCGAHARCGPAAAAGAVLRRAGEAHGAARLLAARSGPLWAERGGRRPGSAVNTSQHGGAEAPHRPRSVSSPWARLRPQRRVLSRPLTGQGSRHDGRPSSREHGAAWSPRCCRRPGEGWPGLCPSPVRPPVRAAGGGGAGRLRAGPRASPLASPRAGSSGGYWRLWHFSRPLPALRGFVPPRQRRVALSGGAA